MKNDVAVHKILDEVHDRITELSSLKLARDFGLDAKESAAIVSTAMLIKEQRETNILLEHVICLLVRDGDHPTPELMADLERRLTESELRG